LALAKDGNADFLLTGDNDLLELKEFGGAKIITISEFLNTRKFL
jgi:predicted nucleic acid-binding protein